MRRGTNFLATLASDLAVSYCFHLSLPKASGCCVGCSIKKKKTSVKHLASLPGGRFGRQGPACVRVPARGAVSFPSSRPAVLQELSPPATHPSFPALPLPSPHHPSCHHLELRLLPLIYRALPLGRAAGPKNTASGRRPAEGDPPPPPRCFRMVWKMGSH